MKSWPSLHAQFCLRMITIIGIVYTSSFLQHAIAAEPFSGYGLHCNYLRLKPCGETERRFIPRMHVIVFLASANLGKELQFFNLTASGFLEKSEICTLTVALQPSKRTSILLLHLNKWISFSYLSNKPHRCHSAYRCLWRYGVRNTRSLHSKRLFMPRQV